MVKTEDGVDYLMQVVELNGAACATVKDGHVIVFKRSMLVDILEKNPTTEKLVIFVKRPDFSG